MSELRLCKEDFLQYRTLEVQEKYYKKQEDGNWRKKILF